MRDVQDQISNLTELDNTKHILAACDGVTPLVNGFLRETASDGAFLLLTTTKQIT